MHIDAEVLPADCSDVILQLVNHRARFAPAVNLPPEVLAIIFEFACCSIEDDIFKANIKKRSGGFWDRDPDIALAATPLLIAQVCSVWRNVALNVAQLWTNITIYHEDKRDGNQASMLEYWLSKSGERPLNVQLMQQQDPLKPTRYIEVIDILVAQSHRLRTLNIFLPTEWESAMTELTDCIPLLTHLSLCIPVPDIYDDVFEEPVDMFTNAPQLRTVALLKCGVANVSLPWAQLETLESRYSSVFECIDTLRLCPRLRHFVVEFYCCTSSTMAQSLVVTHTTLEELKVSSSRDKPVTELLKVLELPALRSFTLLRDEYGSCRPSSFLSRVAGTLETLCLPYNYGSLFGEDLWTTLRVVPQLRRLILVNSYSRVGSRSFWQRELVPPNPNKFVGFGCESRSRWLLDYRIGGRDAIELLGPDESGNGHYLLPNLETFEYEGEVRFAPHVLVGFLVARRRGLSTLAELYGPGKQAVREPAPPKIDALSVRLRSAIFRTPTPIRFRNADAVIIRILRREGLELKFLKSSRREG